jgi:Na+/proline symporter
MSDTAILSPGVGYAIVLAISLGFTVVMIGITKLQERYTKFKQSNLAEFASASHSIKPGLIACAICSSWSWSATLLTSSAMSYSVGYVGGYAYAAGQFSSILEFLPFILLTVSIFIPPHRSSSSPARWSFSYHA